MAQVVTRFAPSNTSAPGMGLHAGSIRTMLFSLAHARRHNGKCLLRIEDTDRKRSTEEAAHDILENIAWLGLEFDHGPSMHNFKDKDVRDKFFQSHRTHIYNNFVEYLLKKGLAYEKDGAIWFTVPQKDVIFHDMILGDIKTSYQMLKDFAIRKADGGPVFHMSVVVDDELMGVTSVIRGQDHIPNTPKHVLLQQALGFKTPEYAHIPLILDEKGAKLSKRREDQCVCVRDFRAAGYLPQVLVNYLSLLGWGPKDKNEFFTFDKMCEMFDVRDVGKSNARFDYKKLDHFNLQYLGCGEPHIEPHIEAYCENYHKEFATAAKALGVSPKAIISIAKGRAKTMKDAIDMCNGILAVSAQIQETIKQHLSNTIPESVNILTHCKQLFVMIDNWGEEEIEVIINDTATRFNKKPGEIGKVLRIALTGTNISPPIHKVLSALGKNESVKRIDSMLGLVSQEV